jgi:hypothetical protein
MIRGMLQNQERISAIEVFTCFEPFQNQLQPQLQGGSATVMHHIMVRLSAYGAAHLSRAGIQIQERFVQVAI